uniref:Calmodulin-lysine N-methyltransferase n=1 Tax=Pinguiococcus pyrenoidosus TaxID=172671 RepID=A0A7R9UF89_9STRA|mmetsp:Transcript_8629/g.32475  ORF Transcript_8629/g.32475 Transcript_8629/m.32475 type:complete len:163 (+) Transcript_8629:245-733(+)
MALKQRMEGKLRVDLTDGDPKAIELLRENAALNGVAEELGIHELFWGSEDSLKAFEEERPDKYPLIIAGDVLYKKSLISPLLETVQRLLRPAGTFFLCHIPRFNVYHEVVADALSDAGWDVRSVIHPEAVLERFPVPETWDAETMSDLMRARIYEIQAPQPR